MMTKIDVVMLSAFSKPETGEASDSRSRSISKTIRKRKSGDPASDSSEDDLSRMFKDPLFGKKGKGREPRR